MPALIKGVVLKKRESLMQVNLITGKRFWTYRREDIGIREFVWVGWNYTQGEPTRIMSESEYLKFLEEEPESEDFSDPDDEGHVNAEVESQTDEEWLENLDAFTDLPESEGRRFSNPLGEEGRRPKPEGSKVLEPGG